MSILIGKNRLLYMRMTEQQLKELLERYLRGTLSAHEKALLETWYLNEAASEKAKLSDQEVRAISQRIRQKLPLDYPNSVKRKIWPRVAAAASLLFLFAFGYYSYKAKLYKKDFVDREMVRSVIAPGKQGATLILSNGEKISLDGKHSGQLADESGVTITKGGDGKLIYQTIDMSLHKTETVRYNTMLTANGEQYQVVLPDGSQVWLNAASSLKYPTSFHGKDRIVELTGEAYFEVAHQASPFKVRTANQEIEVLGTHFNVNSYTDEPSTKTTLLQGKVKVTENRSAVAHILQPGQQSILSSRGLQVIKVDLMDATAWKDGLFRFNGENIESIMRNIARWYNVEVVFEGKISDEVFFGRVDRDLKIDEVLRILQRSQKINFSIEGRRIVVSSKV